MAGQYDHSYRDEAPDPGKFDALEQDGIDRQRPRAAEQQRIAVGFRRCDCLQGDSGAAARPIVDHHRLPEQGGELLADLSRDDVHGAAGQEGNDDPDRPGRCAEAALAVTQASPIVVSAASRMRLFIVPCSPFQDLNLRDSQCVSGSELCGSGCVLPETPRRGSHSLRPLR